MSTWPQITSLAYLAVNFGILAYSAVSKRSRSDIALVFVETTFIMWVLYEGGFFAALGWRP